MKRFLIQISFILACSWMFSGCMEGPAFDVEKKIFVDKATLELLEGDVITITASPTVETFTWESENSSIATVSQSGEVKAVKEGETNIIVKYGNSRRVIPIVVIKFIPVTGIEVSESSLVMVFNKPIIIETASVPDFYTERVPFELKWQSSDTKVVTVDQEGKLEAVDYGNAVVTVSVIDKPSVKTDIQVTVLNTPITSIQVPASLELYHNLTKTTFRPTLMPTNYNVKDSALVWSSDNEAVVKVSNGEFQTVSLGTANVTVSLKSNPSIKATVPVNVITMNVNKFASAGAAGPNCVHSKIYFFQNEEIKIVGLSQSEIADSYNRDFFNFDSGSGKLTFLGETGEYDVLYSSKYSYIWVYKANAVAPTAHWVIGSGKCVPPVWHWDYNNGAWDFNAFYCLGYLRAIGNGKFQGSIYLLNDFDIQVHSDRSWNNTISNANLTGDCSQIYVHSNGRDIMNLGGFMQGYYRLTFESATKTLHFERLE